MKQILTLIYHHNAQCNDKKSTISCKGWLMGKVRLFLAFYVCFFSSLLKENRGFIHSNVPLVFCFGSGIKLAALTVLTKVYWLDNMWIWTSVLAVHHTWYWLYSVFEVQSAECQLEILISIATKYNGALIICLFYCAVMPSVQMTLLVVSHALPTRRFLSVFK